MLKGRVARLGAGMGMKHAVSFILLAASAAYAYWQHIAHLSDVRVSKIVRAEALDYPPLPKGVPEISDKPSAPLPPAPAGGAKPAQRGAVKDAPRGAAQGNPQQVPAAPADQLAPPLTLATPMQHRQYSFADGDYRGAPADSEWGIVEVKVTIRDGSIRNVQFLHLPDHRPRSAEISDWAAPLLLEEAIREQNYDVDVVSSATVTSLAFQQTLYDALRQAKN